MRIIVISDSHDNIVRLNHVIGFGEASGVGAIIHCGDWNTPLAVKHLKSVKMQKFGVLGNADIDPRMPESLKEANVEFNLDFLKLNLEGKLVGICHYPTRLEELAKEVSFDIGFCGHTHQARKWQVGDTPLVNVGALHRTLKPSFAVFDTESCQAELVDVAI